MALRVSDEEYAALRARTGVTPDVTPPPSKKKVNKHNAKIVCLDGHIFRSKMESRRYTELKLLAIAHKIVGLEVHTLIPIDVNGIYICDYEADFCYTEGGEYVVEDVKGQRLPLYKLKRKLVEAVYGIRIKEVQMR